jgi:hypothetical protein
MTVLRAPLFAELLGPDAGLSRSLSSVLTLRFQVRSATSSVKLCYRWKAAVFLRAFCFRRSPRHDHRKKTIQSP